MTLGIFLYHQSYIRTSLHYKIEPSHREREKEREKETEKERKKERTKATVFVATCVERKHCSCIVILFITHKKTKGEK